MRNRLLLNIWLIAAPIGAAPVGALRAQPTVLKVAAGAAVPYDALGAQRSAGPFVRAGVLIGEGERHVQLRVDGEALWMPGTPAHNLSANTTGDIVAGGAMLNMLIGALRSRVGPYVLLGLGAHATRINGADQPNGVIAGLRGGLGLRIDRGRYQLFVEASAHGNLSDRGTGGDFVLGSYAPITVGVTW